MGKKHRSGPYLPSQSQQQNKSVSLQLQHHQGPLPHPAILHEYDVIVPGAAERIIRMAEEQAKHRQELERAVIQSDIRPELQRYFIH